MSFEDRFYKYLKTYKKLPDWIKYLIAFPVKIIPRYRLIGKEYINFYNLADKYEFADKDQIEKYQFNKLKSILKHCSIHVPYYKKLWNDYGINIDHIQNFNDFFKSIPFTTRDIVQKNPDFLLSDNYTKNHILKINTGGSTGLPLSLYCMKGYSRAADNAHIHHLWKNAGFQIDNRLARLRGDYIGRNKIYSWDPWRNVLILNTFKLTEANSDQYIDLLEKFKIQFINAYPSSLTNLIQLSSKNEVNIPTLKGVLLGSENIFPFQIEQIKHFFNLENIYYWYGHGELSALAGKCKYSSAYHFLPTYGYTEFIKPDDSIGLTDDIYEIVVTSFINPVMPLIRYKTQDFGIKPFYFCAKCGKYHKSLESISGREQEIVVGANNERITLTALIFGRHSTYLEHVIKMQIINTSPGNLIVKIVPKKTFNNQNRKELLESLSSKNGLSFNTTVEIVTEIPNTNRGKHKFLIRQF